MYDNYCIFKFLLKSDIARVFVSSRKPYGRITKHQKKAKKTPKKPKRWLSTANIQTIIGNKWKCFLIL